VKSEIPGHIQHAGFVDPGSSDSGCHAEARGVLCRRADTDRLVLHLTQDAANAIDGTVTWNGEIVMTVVVVDAAAQAGP
jgi:hypothetical protein